MNTKTKRAMRHCLYMGAVSALLLLPAVSASAARPPAGRPVAPAVPLCWYKLQTGYHQTSFFPKVSYDKNGERSVCKWGRGPRTQSVVASWPHKGSETWHSLGKKTYSYEWTTRHNWGNEVDFRAKVGFDIKAISAELEAGYKRVWGGENEESNRIEAEMDKIDVHTTECNHRRMSRLVGVKEFNKVRGISVTFKWICPVCKQAYKTVGPLFVLSKENNDDYDTPSEIHDTHNISLKKNLPEDDPFDETCH